MYTPKPEHKFTFGFWTVGNVGRDLFGEPTHPAKSPVNLVHLLAEVGSLDTFKAAYSAAKASALKAHSFDRLDLGACGYQYERLDQLTVELLLGVR